MTAQRAFDLEPIGAPATRTDKELTLAFKSGEKGAYQSIYDLYSPRVNGVCRRMLGNPDDAKEASQETFLRVYQALGKFNGRYQLSPWITRIATNVCLDALRARTRKPSDATPTEVMDDIVTPTSDDDPEMIHIRNAEGRHVRRILASLPPMHRAAIVLRDFEGLSYDEIATALQITECQVKALLHRARKGFKRSWAAARLAALFPARWLKRFHVGPREPTANVAASQQIVDLANSGAHVACSSVVQQCSAFFSERAAAVFMAGAVTIGAGGVGLATASQPEPSPERSVVAMVQAAAEGAESIPQATAPARSSAKRRASAEERTGEKPAGPEPAPVTTEPEPVPAPEPTEAPAPAPEPEPAPEPSPSETAPPPEPDGFVTAFAVDRSAERPPCTCLRAERTISESVSVTEHEGLRYLDQILEGSASAAGTSSYGLELRQRSYTGTDHSLEFTLWTEEGAYHYSASGGLRDAMRTDWGGFSYRFEGTFKLTSRPGGSEAMPQSGEYSATVTASWRQGRIVASTFNLTGTN